MTRKTKDAGTDKGSLPKPSSAEPSSSIRSYHTAAERVRQLASNTRLLKKNETLNSNDTAANENSVRLAAAETVDLDEEIRRLEEELEREEDDDDDSVLSSSTNEATSPLEPENTILCLSKSKDATIASLPTSSLPSIRKKHYKEKDCLETKKGTKRARAIDSTSKSETTATLVVSDGLTNAVKELLRGYKPRSAERLPFYCRVCAKQFENEAGFETHKSEEFHMVAAAMERKASQCKICRKTFTSPTQLQEHLRSKPHKEKMQTMRSAQQRHNGIQKQNRSYPSREKY